MSLHLDELGLGFTGYTLEEGQRILAKAKAGEPVPVPEFIEFTPEGWPCPHRGDLLPEPHFCDLCCGQKGQPLNVYACDIHGQCSIHKRSSKVQACIGCEFAPKPTAPPRRSAESAQP